MTVKSILIDISLTSRGRVRTASLAGYAYVDSGFLKGSLGEGSGMDVTERTLLTSLTFTGCPIAARTSDPTLNPWLKTRGAYVGDRALEGPGFHVRSHVVSISHGDSIRMTLNAEINGEMPSIETVLEPFQEEIRQVRPGELAGNFHLSFGGCRGTVPAQASTKYRLELLDDVGDVWRNITIESSLPEDRLIQVEQIDLFGSQDEAAADLAAKIGRGLH